MYLIPDCGHYVIGLQCLNKSSSACVPLKLMCIFFLGNTRNSPLDGSFATQTAPMFQAVQ